MSSRVVTARRTIITAWFASRFGGLWFFELNLLVRIILVVEIGLDHFSLLFEVVVEREAGIVLKTPVRGARRLGLQR